jgi:biopolymer transport protein ExbD
MARVSERLRDEATRPIEIHPANVAMGPPVNLSLLVRQDGVILGKSQGGGERFFVARCGDRLDLAAVAATLCTLAGEADFAGRQDFEIAALAGVRYGDAMSVMDTAIATGLLDPGLLDPPSLSVPLTGESTGRRVEPACERTPAPCQQAAVAPSVDPAIVPPVGLTLSDAEQKAELKSAPIVSIADGTISLDGTPVAEVSTVTPDAWKIDGLYTALQAAPASGVIIVQADPTTDMQVVATVMKNLYAAGRPNVMFAVRHRK